MAVYVNGAKQGGGTGGSGTIHRGYIDGLVTAVNSVDSDHDIDIGAGEATAIDGTLYELASDITKQIDASWVAGDDNGGMSSSLTLSADTWYHKHLISVSDTIDVGFDTSPTAANLIADHSATSYRRIGAFLTDGSSNIVSYHQDGDVYMWGETVRDFSPSAAATATTQTLTVPTGVRVRADLKVVRIHSAAQVGWVRSVFQDDIAPSQSNSNLRIFNDDGSGSFHGYITTNTSGQIRHREDGTNGSVNGYTLGWIDPRGKNA